MAALEMLTISMGIHNEMAIVEPPIFPTIAAINGNLPELLLPSGGHKEWGG